MLTTILQSLTKLVNSCKNYLPVLLIFFNCNLSLAQQITFNRTYNYNVDGLFNCYPTDSGYYFVMLSSNGVNTRNISIFTFVDTYGDTIFRRHFGSIWDNHVFWNLLPKNDTTFIFGGGCYLNDNNINGGKFYEVNNYGDSLANKIVLDPDSNNFGFLNLLGLSSGGYLITGQQYDTLLQDGQVLIVMLDSNLNYMWKSTFGGLGFDAGYSSIETPDKGFLSLGWTRSFGFGSSSNRDMLLVKWDSVGNKLWHRTYGSMEFDGGTGITATADGNYLLAGYQGVPVGEIRCWIMKIDGAGNVIWSQTYDDGYGELWWARERFDGTIVAAGASGDNTVAKDDGYIVKTDSQGNLLWDRLFNMNNQHAYFRNVAFTPDSGYICAGFAFRGASMTQDAWLVKLDSMGCDSAGCAAYTSLPEVIHRDAEDVKLYPNPVQEALQVEFNYPYLGGLEWRIIDLKGRLIKSRPEYTEQRLRIPVAELSPGMYILELRTDTGRKTKRFVKE